MVFGGGGGLFCLFWFPVLIRHTAVFQWFRLNTISSSHGRDSSHTQGLSVPLLVFTLQPWHFKLPPKSETLPVKGEKIEGHILGGLKAAQKNNLTLPAYAVRRGSANLLLWQAQGKQGWAMTDPARSVMPVSAGTWQQWKGMGKIPSCRLVI